MSLYAVSFCTKVSSPALRSSQNEQTKLTVKEKMTNVCLMSATVTAQTSKNEHLSFRLTFGRYTGRVYKAFADLGRSRAHPDKDLFLILYIFFTEMAK